MQTVACPNCRSQLANDPLLAGQHVQCPLCGAAMMMPSAVAVPVPVTAQRGAQYWAKADRPKATSTPATWVGLAGGGLLLLGIFSPLYSAPIIGSFSLMSGDAQGNWLRWTVAGMGVSALVLAATPWRAALLLIGAVVAGFVAEFATDMHRATQEIQQDAAQNQAVNPGGLGEALGNAFAQHAHLDWGVAVFAASAGLLIACPCVALARARPRAQGSAIALGVATLAVAVIAGVGAQVLGLSKGEAEMPGMAPAAANKPADRAKPVASEVPVQWLTPGKQGGRKGDVRLSVTSAKIERLVTAGLDGERVPFGDPQLIVRIRVENLSPTRKLDYHSAREHATLADEHGNDYLGRTAALLDDTGGITYAAIYPGKFADDLLVFEPPVERAQRLRLTLPFACAGETGVTGFEIPTAGLRSK